MACAQGAGGELEGCTFDLQTEKNCQEGQPGQIFNITVTRHRGFRQLHLAAFCGCESRYYFNDSMQPNGTFFFPF